MVFVPDKHVRIGMSGQLPHIIDAPATIKVRLPNAVEFDTARQDGDNAHVQFELPAIARVGVEGRPIDNLRIEVAYEREFWTTHHSIDIRPDNVKIYGITGFPSPYGVAPISLPRNFENSNSFRLGAELAVKIEGYQIDFRAGVNYETSAIPNAYLAPLTIDLDKVMVGLGGGLHIGKHWRLDAVYAHVFAFDTTVSPAEAAVPRVNPVKGNPTATEAINGGIYSARADLLGVGVLYKF
jgi:long-chain fatty acid transport protein